MLRFGSRPLTDLCYLPLWIFLELCAFYWTLDLHYFAFFTSCQLYDWSCDNQCNRPSNNLCYLSPWIFLEFSEFYWTLYVHNFAFFVFCQCDFILWLIMWYPSHVFDEISPQKRDFDVIWSITSAFDFILFRFFDYFCAIWVYHRDQWFLPLVLAMDHQLIYVVYLYE
jgi:hypothetical protein